jgi:N-sulfoglucosamine sulfohydrolase
MLRNRVALLSLLVLGPSGPFALAESDSGAGGRRNIVLLVSDDHSPDLGVYGNPVIQTPHLDSLARDGIRFTNAFATTASCSASRSVLLTGLHNHRTGQYGHNHDFHRFESWPEIKSLPVRPGTSSTTRW